MIPPTPLTRLECAGKAGGQNRSVAQRTSIGVAVVCAVLACAGARAAETEPDFEKLLAAARATTERLAHDSASWTVVREVENEVGSELRVDVVSAPDGWRALFLIRTDGRSEEFLRIVERERLWYVTEKDAAPTKCRPREYPFAMPALMGHLAECDLRVVDRADRAALVFERVDGDIATYRILTGPAAGRDRRDATRRADEPPAKQNGGLSPRARGLRAELTGITGPPLLVDVRTGVILRRGTAAEPTSVENLRWLDEAPKGALSVAATRWVDRSDGPLDGRRDPNDLLLIAHNATWRPGEAKKHTDGRVLDVRSGRLWRIPFSGAGTLPGCFLAGRKAVAIAGLETEHSEFGLYRVDLVTGETAQLGGDAFHGASPGAMALSPDGRILAVVRMPPTDTPAKRQVLLLDLGRDVAKPLGKPMGISSSVAWLPDASGLIVARSGVVCRLALDGSVTELGRGVSTTVLNADWMLVHDRPNGPWTTCRLDGTDAAPFGDGMKDYTFAAPSPDGKRIVFMREDAARGPTPYLFDIDGTPRGPATRAEGWWALPQWK